MRRAVLFLFLLAWCSASEIEGMLIFFCTHFFRRNILIVDASIVPVATKMAKLQS